MNILTQKSIHLLVLLLMISLGFSSCTEKPSNTIRIGVLEGPSAISFIQMIDKSPVINGKQVEFIIKSDPQQIQALMMQHELDFAVLPTVMAANLYNKGVDFKLVACPIWGTLYLLSNDTNVQSFDDLNNQSVSVFGQGATPDILLQKNLSDKNMENVKIDYSYTGNSEISEALLHKKIKNCIVSEPMVSLLLSKDSSIHIVTKLNCEAFIDNTDKDIFAQTSFVVSNRYIKEYNQTISLTTSAYSNSCKFINEHPYEAAKLLVKHGYIHNLKAAQLSLPLCNIRYEGAFTIERELTRYLNIFYEFDPKSIGGKLPDRNFIYQPQ